MKSMKTVLFSAALITVCGAALAAPATRYAEGITDLSDPGAGEPGWTSLTVIPAPSSTDLVNGIVATQIDARLSIQNQPMNLAALSDGAGTTADLNQLPADFPGVNVPAVSMFWPLAAPSNVGAVIVYCHNWNGGTPDIRGVPVFSVYTTTDAIPTAGGNWTLFLDKAYTNVPALNLEWFVPEPVASPFGETATHHGNAVAVGDDAGGLIATAATGVRVDIYAAGFGSELRNPENTGVGAQAVSSPYIAEVDVLATQPPFPTSVENWSLYSY